MLQTLNLSGLASVFYIVDLLCEHHYTEADDPNVQGRLSDAVKFRYLPNSLPNGNDFSKYAKKKIIFSSRIKINQFCPLERD